MQLNMLEAMNIYVNVVEQGSFIRAAEVLELHRPAVTDIYSSIGCALSSFRPPLGPPFDFLLNFCSCQTARCFNKSKGVLITG